MCIFLGYSTSSKAYRVFDIAKNTVIYAVHVSFSEDQFLHTSKPAQDQNDDESDGDDDETEDIASPMASLATPRRTSPRFTGSPSSTRPTRSSVPSPTTPMTPARTPRADSPHRPVRFLRPPQRDPNEGYDFGNLVDSTVVAVDGADIECTGQPDEIVLAATRAHDVPGTYAEAMASSE